MLTSQETELAGGRDDSDCKIAEQLAYDRVYLYLCMGTHCSTANFAKLNLMEASIYWPTEC